MIRRALARSSEPSRWNELFLYTDKYENGKINLDNFIKVIRAVTNKNMKREEIKAVFNHFDKSGRGEIDYNDLLTRLMQLSDKPVFATKMDDELKKIKETLKKYYKPKIWLYKLQQLDDNKDGLITNKKFEEFFHEIDANISYEEIQILFRHFDKYNDGTIYYDEFLDFLEDKEIIIPPHIRDLLLIIRDTIISKYGNDDWESVFSRFDKNGDGSLSKDELWKALKDMNIQMSESVFIYII